jgi:hypothetical protein
MPAGGVQLADVIVPEVFTEYLGVNSMTSTALFRSGVLVPNQIMQADISRGGNSLNVPAWTDLVSPADPGGADPNLSNDNPLQLSTPGLITAINQQVRKSYLNNSWGSMSFAGELAGSNPMDRIAERVLAYWDRTYEYRLVKSLIGILLSNVANNGSDMVVDISTANPSLLPGLSGAYVQQQGFLLRVRTGSIPRSRTCPASLSGAFECPYSAAFRNYVADSFTIAPHSPPGESRAEECRKAAAENPWYKREHWCA